jgi:glutathione S-transferase
VDEQTKRYVCGLAGYKVATMSVVGAATVSAVVSSATDDENCPRTLYWGSGSPPAWRVRLLLEEKEIAYKSHLISFEDGELQTPLMRSLNPRALVPIFVDGDVVIYESLAILHYVEAKLESDRPSLLPRHNKHYARMLARMQESNNVSATVGEVVYYIRRTKPDEINETYLQAKITSLHQEVSLWERYLESGDDYLAGMDMTLADVAFFPSLAYMKRLGFDLSRYPRLNSYYGRLCQRKSVLASWPPHWLTQEGAVPLKGV